MRRGEADDELAAMVAHYYEACAAPFDLYGGATAAERAAREGDVEELLASPPTRFAGRGQMGEYWLELLRGE